MIMLILSIIYWCLPNKLTLGKVAIALSILGAIIDCGLYGIWCLIDVAIVVVNIMVYEKHKNNYGE